MEIYEAHVFLNCAFLNPPDFEIRVTEDQKSQTCDSGPIRNKFYKI
jgi:hypothetical protein